MPPPRPPALVSGWSDDGVGCVAAILNTVALAPFLESLLSGYVAFCQDPRRFITRLNGCRYLWCLSRLAMTSNKHWCLPFECPPKHRSCQKKRRTTRVYVTVRLERLAKLLNDHDTPQKSLWYFPRFNRKFTHRHPKALGFSNLLACFISHFLGCPGLSITRISTLNQKIPRSHSYSHP